MQGDYGLIGKATKELNWGCGRKDVATSISLAFPAHVRGVKVTAIGFGMEQQ